MNYYLKRYGVRQQLIEIKPSKNIGLIVVIPCCNEPDLISSLQSIYDCCLTVCDIEVIVVVNSSEDAEENIKNQNQKTLLEAKKWGKENLKIGMSFYFIEEHELPIKHAGVGLARKIGMDEAVRRFDTLQKDGVIVCFDADAQCDSNYLVEIEKHFNNNPKTPACSIHFEHPISGEDYPEEIYNGITQYELHLRYYKNGLAFAGLPYAFHTIGSSMAVRSSAYQKQNGMNKRKAGEDFYFLQKLIPLGNFSEIKTTKVIPSPRMSDRVPFGTGRAMQEWLANEDELMMSYNVQSFVDLKEFVKILPELYNNAKAPLPTSIMAFLNTIDFEENLTKIKANSTSATHFVKLFFNWFNAFKVLKFMHFARDNFYEDLPVFDVANALLQELNINKKNDLKSLLIFYRSLDCN